MKSISVLGLLFTCIWLTLIALVIFIERTLFAPEVASNIRSIVGVTLYFAWALTWLVLLLKISLIIIQRLPKPGAGHRDTP